VLVRYEVLVADTLGTMKHLYEELGIEVDALDLGLVVVGRTSTTRGGC